MRAMTVSCGRTFNIGNFSNWRYDLTVEVQDGEALEEAFLRCAQWLHSGAHNAMADMGVQYIYEPQGTVKLYEEKDPEPTSNDSSSDDVDEIPF